MKENEFMKINLLILKSTDWTLRPAMYTNQTHVSTTEMLETLPLMPAAYYNFQGSSSLMFLKKIFSGDKGL